MSLLLRSRCASPPSCPGAAASSGGSRWQQWLLGSPDSTRPSRRTSPSPAMGSPSPLSPFGSGRRTSTSRARTSGCRGARDCPRPCSPTARGSCPPSP
eukprot:90640-Hanusia_phi.AAC.4